jgi:hypothetical protein
MITITETGDHHQPEWLITFTGIRKHGTVTLVDPDAAVKRG